MRGSLDKEEGALRGRPALAKRSAVKEEISPAERGVLGRKIPQIEKAEKMRLGERVGAGGREKDGR